MQILILSCNTGEGHNSCAKALKEVFDSNGHYCVIEDVLSFISKSVSKFLSKGHTIVYRHFPGLFRWGYRYAETHASVYREGSVLYNYFCSGKQRLADYIDAGEYDAVICTHVFAGVMLTDAEKICKTRFYTAFVGTDYTCSPTTEASDLDVYFVPDDTVKKEYVDYGIPEAKLVSSGIPVRQMFYDKKDKETAKKAEGIENEHAHILVMSGSMGCGPIDLLVRHIAEMLHKDEEMTVVCGTNKRLMKKLDKRYRNKPNIHIRGYVNNISSLMDSADLYLTKPGGISVTEAKTKRLPMVFVDAVAGCEEYNRSFFVKSGGAVSGQSTDSLAEICMELMRDALKRKQMTESFDSLQYENSSQYICDYLDNKVLNMRSE